ncbi:MAG: hypothetical protein O3A47_06160 [Chloroflexi bacterium]|nr:hypothetical protein [Chloroflexota bacterium]
MTSPRALTLEDVVGFKRVTDAQISPDGDVVAFVMGDQFTADTKLPRPNVWIVSCAGGEPTQLTNGPRSDTTPRWSPDGRTLAFLSDREQDGQRQICLLPINGGEAMQITRIEGNVPTPRGLSPTAWSPDGKTIAFLMTDPETEEEKRRKREKDDAIEFERYPKYTRLYLVDVETKEVSCVSPDGLQVWEFCWAPSGREVAVVASDLPFEQSWYSCRLAKFSVAGGTTLTLHHGKRQVSSPAWSPDGTLIAFLSSSWSDRGLVAGGIFVMPADGGEVRELGAGDASSTSWLQWSDDSQRLLAVAHERGGTGTAEIEVASGACKSLWHGEATFAEPNWLQFSRDNAGSIAVVREDTETPRDIWLAGRSPAGIEWKRLTRLHPQADDLRLAPMETIHWKGTDGWDMQGLLIRATGGPSQGRRPMVTVVHGGPTSAQTYGYYASHGWFQLLADQGVTVFLPNPRGSTGWGLEFAGSNIGDMGARTGRTFREV